jgi:hypothetical protein
MIPNAVRLPFGTSFAGIPTEISNSTLTSNSALTASTAVRQSKEGLRFFHSISTPLRTRRHTKFWKLLTPVDLISSP